MLANRLSAAAPAGAWWPYDDPFEIALSAVLTQRTRWGGAARAMDNLRAAGLLAPRALAAAPRRKVEQALRPASFYRQKARAVQGIARAVRERFGASFARVLALSDGDLRAELLSWPGVGDETADAILLFAAGRRAFVVDAYTVRLMRRFGATGPRARPSYAAVAGAWARQGEAEPSRAKALHASIVEVCKDHCRAIPECRGCPLEPDCQKVGLPK